MQLASLYLKLFRLTELRTSGAFRFLLGRIFLPKLCFALFIAAVLLICLCFNYKTGKINELRKEKRKNLTSSLLGVSKTRQYSFTKYSKFPTYVVAHWFGTKKIG